MVCLMCASAPLPAQVALAPPSPLKATQVPLAEARRLMDAGDFQGAANLLEGYVQAQPKSAAGHTLLAYCALRLDDPKRSLTEYTAAAAIERPSADDLQNVAKDYVLLGDTASAEHWMLVSLKMNDKDPEGWYGLGRIRYTQQRFQEAADCFQRALALEPRSVKAENNLGLSYEGLDRMDDAMAAYRQAIAWQKGDAHPSEQPLVNLGILLEHQEKLEEARGLLAQAVAIAPNDPRIHEQLGHVDIGMNRLREAQEQLEAAVKIEPQKASLHFLLGKVFHLEGEESKAKAEFALSATLSGTHASPEPE